MCTPDINQYLKGRELKSAVIFGIEVYIFQDFFSSNSYIYIDVDFVFKIRLMFVFYKQLLIFLKEELMFILLQMEFLLVKVLIDILLLK